MSRRSARARRRWGGRAASWDDQVVESPAFDLIRSAVMAATELTSADVVVDLGAGTGFLTLPCAETARGVIAVDVSPDMLRILETKAARLGCHQVEVVVADLADFDLPPNSVDVVVSSYALHHLTDHHKEELIRRAARWLRPGGRLVIADMMFGRGGSRHDREIILLKARRMLRKGPAGVWRLLRNLVRFGLRRGEDLPVPSTFWVQQLLSAGLHQVEARTVTAEAGLVVGRRAHDVRHELAGGPPRPRRGTAPE